MPHKQIRLPDNTQNTYHYRANFVLKMRYSTGDSYLSFLSYSESIGCFCIRNYQRKFGYFKHEEYFRLFDSMVSPIFCFGSEVWGYEYSSVIESVHNDFCKKFLGVNSSVKNVVALGECGRPPQSVCNSYIHNKLYQILVQVVTYGGPQIPEKLL